jgi:hypothetical protein
MTLTQPTGAEEKLYVTPNQKDGIIVRDGPGLQYNFIDTAFIGDRIEVLEDTAQALAKIGQRGPWLKVRTPNGISGWVFARFVQRATADTTPTPTPTPVEPPVVVPIKPLALHTTAQGGLYVRTGPGSEYHPLTSVLPSQRLEALGAPSDVRAKLGKYGEWIQLKTPQGATGYSAAWYLEEIIEPFVWTLGHALVGLHGPAEPWSDRWDTQAYQIVQQARIEAIKLLASNELLASGPDRVTDVLNRLRAVGVRFFMARLLYAFGEPRTPEQFVEAVLPATRCLFERGVQYFEVHNEPNLNTDGSREGMWVAWQNGREFGAFFEKAVGLLREQLPAAYFGFPAVSSGFDIPKVRANSDQFLSEASDAIKNSADFICMHTYWGIGGTTYLDSINEVKKFCSKYFNKLVFVSEFDNGSATIGKDIKGREYAQFYTEAKKLPANLGALFSFVLSAAEGNNRRDFPDEIWIDSPIAQYVGARSVV